jgi:hypothetical protein
VLSSVKGYYGHACVISIIFFAAIPAQQHQPSKRGQARLSVARDGDDPGISVEQRRGQIRRCRQLKLQKMQAA